MPTGQHCVLYFSSNCRRFINPAPAANPHAVQRAPVVVIAPCCPALIIAKRPVQLAAVLALNAMRFRFVKVFRFRVRCLTIRADRCRCVFCRILKHYSCPRAPATHAATSARNAARLPQPSTTIGNADRSAALISVVRAMPTVSASAVPIVHKSPGSCFVCAICSHPSQVVDSSSQSASGFPHALHLSICVALCGLRNARPDIAGPERADSIQLVIPRLDRCTSDRSSSGPPPACSLRQLRSQICQKYPNGSTCFRCRNRERG